VLAFPRKTFLATSPLGGCCQESLEGAKALEGRKRDVMAKFQVRNLGTLVGNGSLAWRDGPMEGLEQELFPQTH